MKALIHGCFDVLHPGHKSYIQKVIAEYNLTEIVVGLWTDERIKQRKGNTRPLFTYDWREQDLVKFLTTLNIRYQIEQLTIDKYEKGYIDENLLVITARPKGIPRTTNLESTFSYRLESNGFKVKFCNSETTSYHTSDIEKLLLESENNSICITKKVGAVLVRDGVPVASGSNASNVGKYCKRCEYNLVNNTFGLRDSNKPSCAFPHAEQVVLEYSKPGDDLFISYTPCYLCTQLILEKKINRVVCFKQGNPDYLSLLKNSQVINQ